MYLGAWASGMSAWTGNRTGTKGGAQSEREGAGAQKERARRRNKGRRERKSASFRPRTAEFEMHELFVAREVGFIERKCLLLQANKHNISLFLPQCGVHIAQNRVHFPDEPTQTIFDFRLFATTQQTLPRLVPPIEGLFRGRRFARCLSPLGKCIVVHRDRNNLCMRTFSDVKYCPSANI